MADRKTQLSQAENAMLNAECVRMLYANSPFVMVGVIAVSAMTCLIFWDDESKDMLMLWLAANILLTLMRFIAGRKFFSNFDSGGLNIFNWVVLSCAGALLSGILWGTLPWLILDVHVIFNVLFIALILLGMVASAIGSYAPYPIVYYCYAVPVVSLLALKLAIEGGDFIYIAAMIMFFLLVNIGYVISQNRLIINCIKQRYKNLELVKHLGIKNQEAEQANSDKSRFLAATSHDLRQPLHALDLFLGAMIVEIANIGRSNLDKLLFQARESSRALGDLLNALLNISRLDTGDVQVNQQVIYLPEMMQKLVNECRNQFEKQGRELRLKIISASVESDPVLLMRLIRNYIMNAMAHTNGNILLGARKRGEWIRIEVWDQGDGLSKEDQEHIFSEFYQLNNPERDRNKGLGLGLAIVKRISVLLNHAVLVRSWIDCGSCFSVDVPMLSMNVPQPSELVRHNDIDLSGVFALIVDDEAAIRNGMQLLLRSWDCEVLVSASGEEALRELQMHAYPPPDVLIMDYRLRKGETGTQVADQICKLFNRNIPILIISGDTHAELDQLCQRLHYTLLHKPVNPDALKRALAENIAQGNAN